MESTQFDFGQIIPSLGKIPIQTVSQSRDLHKVADRETIRHHHDVIVRDRNYGREGSVMVLSALNHRVRVGGSTTS